MGCSSGADKSIENDEPLFFSSSSSDDEDEPIREEEKEREVAPKTSNPRKRPAGGHTPLDLAKCQKVSCTFKIKAYFSDVETTDVHVIDQLRKQRGNRFRVIRVHPQVAFSERRYGL